ncbi:unnamed protein product [Prorocentrum cordatum]|uniref:Uncharacterized protein n=1 Tax=Prorocentrum cordatum TaxID=2364126 RepID=A0ABN9SLI3_9DINO|nr:unnamed protein product [Polarella glacialis]
MEPMGLMIFEKIIFTTIASALQADTMAAFEQTSTEARDLIGATRTWAGREAANVNESMREACPWNEDGSFEDEYFVYRVVLSTRRAAVLQAFAVAKGLDLSHFENDGTWNFIPRSWSWTASYVPACLIPASVFYDSLCTLASLAGHKGIIKACLGVVNGTARMRRLATQAKAGRLDTFSLIAELEVCLVARFILDSSVGDISTCKEEWCDRFRRTDGFDPLYSDSSAEDSLSVSSEVEGLPGFE